MRKTVFALFAAFLCIECLTQWVLVGVSEGGVEGGVWVGAHGIPLRIAEQHILCGKADVLRGALLYALPYASIAGHHVHSAMTVLTTAFSLNRSEAIPEDKTCPVSDPTETAPLNHIIDETELIAKTVFIVFNTHDMVVAGVGDARFGVGTVPNIVALRREVEEQRDNVYHPGDVLQGETYYAQNVTLGLFTIANDIAAVVEMMCRWEVIPLDYSFDSELKEMGFGRKGGKPDPRGWVFAWQPSGSGTAGDGVLRRARHLAAVIPAGEYTMRGRYQRNGNIIDNTILKGRRPLRDFAINGSGLSWSLEWGTPEAMVCICVLQCAFLVLVWSLAVWFKKVSLFIAIVVVPIFVVSVVILDFVVWGPKMLLSRGAENAKGVLLAVACVAGVSGLCGGREEVVVVPRRDITTSMPYEYTPRFQHIPKNP